jgi:nucleoside-diphosphate-sugar epimerase
MRILITGATGFIGKRLAERLLEKGHDISCLVRKTSKTDFLKKRKVPLFEADITDAGEVEGAFRQARPEYVFHCAARVKDTDENLYRTNVLGTMNICRACLEYGVQRLVYLSSVAVISGNEVVPLTEDLPYKTTLSYGRSKAEAEQIAVNFRKKGLPVAIIRPCMVIGEGEPHMMSTILKRASRGLIPTLKMSGLKEGLRLVYVDNVVQVLEAALEKKEALQGTFFVADKEIITIRKFLDIIYDELGSGKPPVIPDWLVRAALAIPPVRRKFDRIFKDRIYDISRAQNILGYDPEVSTEEGLRRTVRHWKEARV